MTETVIRTALPERQRRRGTALADAIHHAVFVELAEVGYAAFTIEAVAARARTGKSSIYRRWETKQDLVVDAFIAHFGRPDELVSDLLVDNDAPIRDLLVTLATRICRAFDHGGELMRAVACEATRDSELAAAVDEKVHRPKHDAFVELLQLGVDRGELRADALCDLYADLLPAMLTYRMVLNNQRVTQHDAEDIVDRVVMPLISAR
jgi:AcrR family transcriptional regulator